jgi:nitric oxide reductase NorD protein
LRDTLLATRLPGIARILSGPTVPLTDGPQSSLQVALSRQPLPSTPVEWGVIRPSRLWKASPAPPGQAQSANSARLNAAEEDSEAEQEARRALDRLFDAPGIENSLLSRILRNAFESRSSTGRARNNSGPAGEYSRSRGFKKGSVTTRFALPTSTEPGKAGPLPGNVVGWYPEWEAAKDRYLSRWCRVVELPTACGNHFKQLPPVDYRFRRRLARTGLCHDRRRREPVGQDLDLDAVIHYQIDRAAGTNPGERIWLNHTLSRRDLAVLILLDASGSAAEGDGRSVLAEHIAAAAATVESLHRLGARVAAVSFEGRGRKLVRFTRLKSFHEHGTGAFRARIGSVKPEGFTRLGAAIRHATTILRQEGGAAKRLLVVFSDGFPYDDG